jgi:hypothetical protein
MIFKKEIIDKLIKVLKEEEKKYRKLGKRSPHLYDDESFVNKYLTKEELDVFKEMIDNYRLIAKFYKEYNEECWKTYLKVENKKKKELLNKFAEFL